MHSGPKIIGKLSVLTMGMVLCSLPIIFLLVMPNFVPEHRIVQTQFFGVVGIVALLVVTLSFAWGPRYYFFVMSLAISVLPYFSSYLAPFGGQMLSAAPEMSLALLCLLLIMMWMANNRIKVTSINVFIVLWILLNSLSLLFSSDPMKSLPLFGVGVVFSGLYLFILHNIILNRRDGLRLVLISFIVSNLLFILFGFIVTWAYTGWSSIIDIEASRLGANVNTGHYGSNAYGGIILLSLPIFFWALVVKPKYLGQARFLLWPVFIIGLALVVLSASRGNIISLGFLLIFFATYMFRTFYKGRSLLGMSALLALQLWVISSADFIQSIIVRFVDDRQLSITSMLQRTMENIRVVLAETSWEIFKDNWLFGVGQGNLLDEIASRTGIHFDAHNLALNVLTEQGVLVFLLVVVYLFYITYLLWKTFKGKGLGDRWLALCCFAALMAFLLRSCLTGGTLAGTQFIGAQRVCWMLTIGAIIYNLAKSPEELTDQEAPQPADDDRQPEAIAHHGA